MSKHPVFSSFLKRPHDGHRYSADPFGALADFKTIIEKAKRQTVRELSREIPDSLGAKLFVVYPCLSSSSDDHPLWHSCLGTGMRVESQKQVLSISRHLWFIRRRPLFAVVVVGVWWEQYHDTATSGTDYSDLRSMARHRERIDEETAVGPRFGQDPPPSFSAPTLAYTYRQWKRDLRLWQATSSLQKNRQGRWLMRQLKGESRTAAEVVMDDALVQDDGIDLIVEKLDRCWEVTQDQDKASKIEKAFETQRDVKMEATFMSYVARRKLNFQQLENALGTSLPAVIKGYATLRDAKLAESSHDKVVTWTGRSYD